MADPLQIHAARLENAAQGVKAIAQSLGIAPPDKVTPEFAHAIRHQLERRRAAVLSAVLSPEAPKD